MQRYLQTLHLHQNLERLQIACLLLMALGSAYVVLSSVALGHIRQKPH